MYPLCILNAYQYNLKREAMKYSISNWIYGGEPLETTFKRLQRYNYDGVELEGEPDFYRVDEVKRLCYKYNLSVLSIAGMYPWPTDDRDIASPDSEARKKAINYMQRCIDLASGTGAPLLIVVPSAVGRVSPLDNFNGDREWIRERDKTWNRAVLAVREAAEYAGEKGILLAIEPINRYETFLINTAEDGLKFIEEVNSPAVKIHLDTFHMNVEEINPAESIRRCGELLVNFHVADSNRQAVGNGHFDFKAVMNALKEIDYKWTLAMEPLPPVPNPYIAIRLKQYEYLRDEYAEQCITRLREMEK
jgi:D-psicose/D-tagatose/L-ribulose 3-epimerase